VRPDDADLRKAMKAVAAAQGLAGLLWNGPPLPPVPGYGAIVSEKKERTDDYRDPWN
jgi:hypothetical protein